MIYKVPDLSAIENLKAQIEAQNKIIEEQKLNISYLETIVQIEKPKTEEFLVTMKQLNEKLANGEQKDLYSLKEPKGSPRDVCLAFLFCFFLFLVSYMYLKYCLLGCICSK